MLTRNVAAAMLMIVAVAGCNSEKQNGQYEIVTLQEETLPPVQPLQLEKININEDYIMGNPQKWIYQDSILIVLKYSNSYPLKKLLTLVNLNTGNIISDYFSSGRGPGELLGAIGKLSNNRLDILSNQTGRLVSVNIDSAIMYGNAYKPIMIIPEQYSFSEWCALDDTLFLTVNDYYFDGNNEYCKANAQLPEFYWYDKYGKSVPEYYESDYREVKYQVQNISRLTISINKKKNRVVCCNYFRPYIKVYDLDLNPIRRIIGPEPDDGKYSPMDDFGIIFFDENKGKNYYYSSVVSDNDNIFVYNFRAHNFKEPGEEQRLEKKNENAEIFRLDWDGNVIGRYSAKGKIIWQFNYCKNSNTLYLQIIDEDGEGYMYKAKL